MNFLQFLLILKARFMIILVTFVVVVLVSLIVTLSLPKSFQATTSLLLNYKGMDPVTGVVLPAQLVPGYMATQVDIIQSRNIALKVVDKLGLADSPHAQKHFQAATDGHGDIKNWLADMLLKKLVVTPSKESSVLEISYTAVDPDFAAEVVNAFADNYLETSVQLKVEPAQKAAGYFGKQIKSLRDNLELAQNRLAKYQQEHGITNPEQSYDVESMRLNELSTQLSIAEAAAIEAQSRRATAQSNAMDSPDVQLSPVIQNLKVDAARAETKLAEMSHRLGANHPQYQSAANELAKLKSQINAEVQSASNSVTGSANIQASRAGELRAQVAMQKQKVLSLNRLRSEMGVLQKDVETAQKAMDAVSQRYSQTNIEAQSNQSEIAILNPAISPLLPSSPRILASIAMSILLGAVLGIGFGLLAELMDRRVRSRDDIAELLGVPVFAISKGRPVKDSMKLLPRNSGPKFLTA
jgi:succinoglycan biosynthesis transport protein ExoP